jgi:hypothetical protein
MPYKKTEHGKWVKTLGRRSQVDAGPAKRLLIVDTHVDKNGIFKTICKPDVLTITFDSKKHELDDIVNMIRTAHRTNGCPFFAIALANHGPDKKGEWKISKDVSVDLSEDGESALDMAKDAADTLSSFLESMIAALEKTAINAAHIDLLACNLADVNSSFLHYIEELYHVDFRASTDVTGNATSKIAANWKMETDGDYDFSKEFLDAGLTEKYQEHMCEPITALGITVTGVVLSKCL